MHIKDELHAVTVEISEARRTVADLQALCLLRRRRLSDLEAGLATARIALMSRSEAGSNDTQRRAYAERETAEDRELVIAANRAVVEAEVDLVQAQATLAIATDRRRYLESIIRLMVEHATDLIRAAYADDPAPNGSGDYSEDNPPF